MNIQFMTKANNGIPTGEVDWKGRPVYKYRPDYDEMIANATGEEEANALRRAKETMEKMNDGFTFEIVFTAIATHVDPWTCAHPPTWQVLQHPWYRDQHAYWPKEMMIEEIEKTYQN